MNDYDLQVAGFAKMARGEALSLSDTQRVWEVVINNGLNVDSNNQQAIGQLVSQIKSSLQQKFFSEQ